MGKGEKVKKFKRKIKIRLLDSSDPNSYICELFESSFENTDSSFEESQGVSSEVSDSPSLKSYFEILMSNDCRKNLKNLSTKENNEVYRSAKPNHSNSKEAVGKKGLTKLKNGSVSFKVVNNNESEDYETNSSEEESLFQVQENYKINSVLKKSNLNTFTKTKKGDSDTEIVDEKRNEFPTTDFISQKRNINLLNYFSKNETCYKSQLDKVEKLGGMIRKDRKFKSSNCKNEQAKSENQQLRVTNEKKEETPVVICQKQNVKIAPLFQIKEKKILDLAAKKARYNFLHSESTFPKSSNANANAVVDLVLDFQPTCHVQQRDDSIYWSLREIPSPIPEVCLMEEFQTTLKFKMNIACSNLIRNDCRNSEEVKECSQVKINNKTLGEIKLKYKNLNMDTVIDSLKLKRDKFISLTKEIRSSRKVDRSMESLNTQWIEKYKLLSKEMLGNEKVVEKLKSWLQMWKTFDEELKNLAKTNKAVKKNDSEEDSDDDYFIKPGQDNYGLKAPASVCLLSGPNGCGKTTLVSSLAEELEFNVLEVNASSKRTGKKVLTDFQEATQSHKVQHASMPQLQTFFKSVKRPKGKGQRKVRKTPETNEESNDRKISLLLIEDADIVFEEHDEGFYSAVASLVQTSKRPFVFITDNFGCEQLDNFKTEDSLILKMEHPPFVKACAFLDVVSQLEGAPIDEKTAEFLLLQNRFDLRKSLLELQFWNGPNLETLKSREPFDLGRFWWGLAKFLYPKISTGFLGPVQFKRKRQDDVDATSEEGETATKKAKIEPETGRHVIVPVPDSSSATVLDDEIRTLSDLLDVASVISLIGYSCGDEPIPGIDYKPKSSLCLEENREGMFCTEKTFKEELCNGLIAMSSRYFRENRTANQRQDEKISLSNPSWEDVRWRNSQEQARDQLSFLVPPTNGRDKRSLHLDYLPVIRSICRHERNRSVTNSKRKKRFCHYFNGSEVELSEKVLDVGCQVFAR